MERDTHGSSGVEADEPSSPVAAPGEDAQPSPTSSPPKKKHKKTKRQLRAEKKVKDRTRLAAKRAEAKGEGGAMPEPSHAMKVGAAARFSKLNETQKFKRSAVKQQAVQRALRSRLCAASLKAR